MRVRYWHLTIKEVLDAKYPVEKANHWDIKCMQGEYEHFGVFWYRYGTPFDKDAVHGICFYHNDIPKQTVEALTEFLQSKFGGQIMPRQQRVFLYGSKEFADPKSVAILANELSLKFNSPVELTIELEKATKEEVENESYNLPASKSLAIVGPD